MRDSFIFYRSFYESSESLPEKDQLLLYKSIAEYVLNDKKPELTGVVNTIFTLIKPLLDANNTRYKNGLKGKKYGHLGGRPQDNPKQTPKITPPQSLMLM